MALPRNHLSRRGVLAAGGAAALGLVLAACGAGDAGQASPGPSGGGTAGPWSFTDDRDVTVTLDAAPTRLVAFTGAAGALADYGLADKIVGVFGETKRKDGTPEPQAGELDVNKVTVLGNVWGEFNIEKYASLRPELLITHEFEPGSLWYVPDESKDKITQLAPSVAIRTGKISLLTPVQRYAALAEALGADMNSAKVTEAKARFDAAVERLRKAAADKPDIKVMAASASSDLFYVSTPKATSDLMYFSELGVNLVVPDKVDDAGYFESLSWENADKYDADVILLDNRTMALQPDDLTGKPAWARLPAVKAGQVTPWDAVPRHSYAGVTPVLESLAEAIENAKKVSEG